MFSIVNGHVLIDRQRRFAHVTFVSHDDALFHSANANKMAAFLQWRKFVFFDKDTVKDPVDNGKSCVLPSGVSACDSGRGHIVLGDILYLQRAANVVLAPDS